MCFYPPSLPQSKEGILDDYYSVRGIIIIIIFTVWLCYGDLLACDRDYYGITVGGVWGYVYGSTV